MGTEGNRARGRGAVEPGSRGAGAGWGAREGWGARGGAGAGEPGWVREPDGGARAVVLGWGADPGPGRERRVSAASSASGGPGLAPPLGLGPLPSLLGLFLKAHLETLSWSDSAASGPDNQSPPSPARDSLAQFSPGPFWGVQALSPERRRTSRGVH